MKVIIYTIIALVTLVFGGCSYGSDEVQISDKRDALTIVMPENPTVRTLLGEVVDGARMVYWSAGDCIAANGVTSYEAQIDEERLNVATFEFGKELTYPSNVLYPASFYKDEATITLPKVQPEAEGTFATNTFPMAAYVATEASGVAMQHLASVIHLQIKDVAGDDAGKHAALLRVEFRGNNSEAISGDFSVNYADATLLPAENGTKNLETVVKVGGNLSTTEVKDIFVVVPAQPYSRGFTIRVIDKAGHFMDKKAPAMELVRGKIYKMPPFEFVPTGSIVVTEIK